MQRRRSIPRIKALGVQPNVARKPARAKEPGAVNLGKLYKEFGQLRQQVQIEERRQRVLIR
jgi:hypothetical protein